MPIRNNTKKQQIRFTIVDKKHYENRIDTNVVIMPATAARKYLTYKLV
jgi:hypothetical protein